MLDKAYNLLYASGSEATRSIYHQEECKNMPTLPAGTRGPASVSYLDAGGERGSAHFWFPVITAANEAAQSTAFATLLGTMDAITLGARVRDQYVDETTYAVARPTNGAARELALKVVFRDATTGQTWDSVIPTLDPASVTYDINYGARDVVIIEDGALVEALRDALEAMPPRNPYAYANSGVVVGMQVIRGSK